jgi:hypothetical protein
MIFPQTPTAGFWGCKNHAAKNLTVKTWKFTTRTLPQFHELWRAIYFAFTESILGRALPPAVRAT